MMQIKQSILFLTLIFLGAFSLATVHLDRDSFWGDEGWSMWAVRGDSLHETLLRVGNDVHPPLYFVLLDGWTTMAGESVYAVRMLSALFGLIGLAATYVVAKQCFNEQVGLLSMCLLGTSGFWLYYAREARMYTLLLALAALTTWIYLRWLNHPTPSNTLIYAVLAALLVYTHYDGALIIASHGLHLMITHPRRWPRWLIPVLLAVILYVPWIKIGLRQIQTHPSGPLALPLPTNFTTVYDMIGRLIGGYWSLLLLPSVIAAGVLRLRRDWSNFVLIGIWVLLTPSVVLSLNRWIAPVYQIRYIIGILPGVMVVEAYGLYYGCWRRARLVLLVIVIAGQLKDAQSLWPPKPAWEPTLQHLAAARSINDPIVVLFQPDGVETYYDRQLGIRRGDVINLAKETPIDPSMLSRLDEMASVWIALPPNIYHVWDAISTLDTHHHATYRDSVANLVIYRFEAGDTNDLHFQFGGEIDYQGLLGNQFDTMSGEMLCVPLDFSTRVMLNQPYSVGLHLVDIQNRPIAQWDGGLGNHTAGENFTIESCVQIPANPGTYRLIVVIYNWMTGERLPLYEQLSGQPPISWLDTLVIGTVTAK